MTKGGLSLGWYVGSHHEYGEWTGLIEDTAAICLLPRPRYMIRQRTKQAANLFVASTTLGCPHIRLDPHIESAYCPRMFNGPLLVFAPLQPTLTLPTHLHIQTSVHMPYGVAVC
jgi:hypothetical protein